MLVGRDGKGPGERAAVGVCPQGTRSPDGVVSNTAMLSCPRFEAKTNRPLSEISSSEAYDGPARSSGRVGQEPSAHGLSVDARELRREGANVREAVCRHDPYLFVNLAILQLAISL